METDYGGLEWEQSKGIVINLITQGLYQKEIRALIPVGGSHTSRLKKAIDSILLISTPSAKTGEFRCSYSR